MAKFKEGDKIILSGMINGQLFDDWKGKIKEVIVEKVMPKPYKYRNIEKKGNRRIISDEEEIYRSGVVYLIERSIRYTFPKRVWADEEIVLRCNRIPDWNLQDLPSSWTEEIQENKLNNIQLFEEYINKKYKN